MAWKTTIDWGVLIATYKTEEEARKALQKNPRVVKVITSEGRDFDQLLGDGWIGIEET